MMSSHGAVYVDRHALNWILYLVSSQFSVGLFVKILSSSWQSIGVCIILKKVNKCDIRHGPLNTNQHRLRDVTCSDEKTGSFK